MPRGRFIFAFYSPKGIVRQQRGSVKGISPKPARQYVVLANPSTTKAQNPRGYLTIQGRAGGIKRCPSLNR
jgi:hypothetical protein